jgi:hypothetical protein
MQCSFREAWIGRCKKEAAEGEKYCLDHKGRKCCSCGNEATHTCEETGQFVCGENLCDGCEHMIFPSGTNGGIGFRMEKLPEGMPKCRHVKKGEQKYTPWWEREEAEECQK